MTQILTQTETKMTTVFTFDSFTKWQFFPLKIFQSDMDTIAMYKEMLVWIQTGSSSHSYSVSACQEDKKIYTRKIKNLST